MKKESSWLQLISSIEVHRDSRARYFKPVCVIAVCSLIDKGELSTKAIPANVVVNEFQKIVSQVFPLKAGNGWMPLWHLMRDGAWVCKKNGVPTRREVFTLTKPKSKKELLSAVDEIDCSSTYGQLWSDKQSRDQLRGLMIALLLSDLDQDANLMGEYLIALKEFNSDSPDRLEQFNEANNQVFELENYARYRVHKSIERSSKISKNVKKLQGYSCLACDFNFAKVYGDLGLNYIEAHHVNPVSMNKGKVKKVNLNQDFLVLCANCHKMIHRLGEPWTRERLDDLKAILKSN